MAPNEPSEAARRQQRRQQRRRLRRRPCPATAIALVALAATSSRSSSVADGAPNQTLRTNPSHAQNAHSTHHQHSRNNNNKKHGKIRGGMGDGSRVIIVQPENLSRTTAHVASSSYYGDAPIDEPRQPPPPRGSAHVASYSSYGESHHPAVVVDPSVIEEPYNRRGRQRTDSGGSSSTTTGGASSSTRPRPSHPLHDGTMPPHQPPHPPLNPQPLGDWAGESHRFGSPEEEGTPEVEYFANGEPLGKNLVGSSSGTTFKVKVKSNSGNKSGGTSKTGTSTSKTGTSSNTASSHTANGDTSEMEIHPPPEPHPRQHEEHPSPPRDDVEEHFDSNPNQPHPPPPRGDSDYSNYNNYNDYNNDDNPNTNYEQWLQAQSQSWSTTAKYKRYQNQNQNEEPPQLRGESGETMGHDEWLANKYGEEEPLKPRGSPSWSSLSTTQYKRYQGEEPPQPRGQTMSYDEWLSSKYGQTLDYNQYLENQNQQEAIAAAQLGPPAFPYSHLERPRPAQSQAHVAEYRRRAQAAPMGRSQPKMGQTMSYDEWLSSKYGQTSDYDEWLHNKNEQTMSYEEWVASKDQQEAQSRGSSASSTIMINDQLMKAQPQLERESHLSSTHVDDLDVVSGKQVILRPRLVNDDVIESNPKQSVLPPMGSAVDVDSSAGPVVYYYDPRTLHQSPSDNADNNGEMDAPELTLPEIVYDSSGRALDLEQVHAGGRNEVFLEVKPRAVWGSDLEGWSDRLSSIQSKLQFNPLNLGENLGGGSNNNNNNNNGGTSQSQDQLIVLCTVATMAVMVGALSAKRLRSKKLLESCMHPELDEDWEEDFNVSTVGSSAAASVRYDKKFDVDTGRSVGSGSGNSPTESGSTGLNSGGSVHTDQSSSSNATCQKSKSSNACAAAAVVPPLAIPPRRAQRPPRRPSRSKVWERCCRDGRCSRCQSAWDRLFRLNRRECLRGPRRNSSDLGPLN
mmetsp:Transcript_1475/g.3144  ORF Transcript_1475/g.3144 Transcript_1475/m.3144 type:complete len:959 (+) Transcript_1475:306-3182(+)